MPKRTNAQWQRSPRVRKARLSATLHLRKRGFSYKEIAIAMNTTPEPVRHWEARARRLTRCNCPAAVDITYTGHLPECPSLDL